MYSNYLSWKSLKEMLERLKFTGLITEEIIPGNKRTKKKYFITSKGKQAIESVDELRGLLSPDD